MPIAVALLLIALVASGCGWIAGFAAFQFGWPEFWAHGLGLAIAGIVAAYGVFDLRKTLGIGGLRRR